MAPSRSWAWRGLLIALAVVGAVAFGMAVLGGHGGLPSGPQPITWDRQACARCGMQIGDPSFAAQIQTTDGEVLDFDDPGCLMEYASDRAPSLHAVWFHHLREDRWLPKDKAAFVEVKVTPMGHGLGVVDVGTPDSIGYDAARARVRGRPKAASRDASWR